MKKIFLFLISILFALQVCFTQSAEKYLEKSFIDGSGDTLLYRIMYPVNYSNGKKFPLLIFLHGAGERGNDNKLQLVHGASLFARQDIVVKYPAIVLFPQCPQNSSWSFIDLSSRIEKNWSFPFYEKPMPATGLLIQLIDKMISEENVDTDRLYLSGLSMGGFGSFDLLARLPGKFAAAAPICGGGNSALVGMYHDTPIWIFHGAKDAVVPVENSRKMYEAIKKLNPKVRYTEYPDYNHNSWDAVFADPEYLEWMFSQKRK